ncbi:hypothetical protein EVA_21976, partial [gut metagenome]
MSFIEEGVMQIGQLGTEEVASLFVPYG